MKLFTIKDFKSDQTEEGASYSNCVMANGLEVQIEALSWGWLIGVYNVHGRLILQTKQPYMITLAGGVNYDLSNELMLAEVSKLYDKALSYKQIIVN